MKANKLFFYFLSLVLVLSGAVNFGTVCAQTETETVAVEVLENQLTRENLTALNNGAEKVYVHDGRVTFVDGTCSDEKVLSIEEAADVVVSMIELLGGDTRTQFIPWRTLTDTVDNKYYTFQQIYAGTTVLGGAAKVITDSEGNMIGFSSSIETELPDVEDFLGITAEEAEQIVLAHAEETNMQGLTILEGLTDRIILPMILDVNSEEDESSRFVWVVYTDNPVNPMNHSAELPYLAHYVTMDGKYLYSLETIMPGDKAGSTGFDSEYVFEFMEPVEYTGYVDLSDGGEKEITVTVMRDKRTGMYYLGNIERKIVVADCYEFLYNNGNLRIVSSPDNLEWDQVGLLSFYNYCRVYDYYKEIGWIGGDGLGTPILILNDYQDINHNQVNNAAFVGTYMGWSMFLTSYANDFSQCIDVIAHEFTHCVTGAVMTYNSYMNDYGAINEGLSDIQGKICEMMVGDTKPTSWVLGDLSSTAVRSMDKPHLFGQPEFAWDLYYIPKVNVPTPINDWGGVHTNSSLINNLAYRLIANGGMSLEEARAYFFAVDCTAVPGTDYAQMSELLPWVLKSQGMEKYDTALQAALDATRMNNDTLPDFFDEDRALVELTLPDKEAFQDGNWAMWIASADVSGIMNEIGHLIEMMITGDYSELPEVAQEILNSQTEAAEAQAQEDDSFELKDLLNLSFFSDLKEVFDIMEQPTPTPTPIPIELTNAESNEIAIWLKEEFAELIYSSTSYAGQDGRTIRTVTIPGRTIPVLLYMSFDEKSEEVDRMGFAVYLNSHWYMLPPIDKFMSEEYDINEDEAFTAMMDDIVAVFTDNFNSLRDLDNIWDMLTFKIKGGEVNVMSSDGLESIEIPEKLPEDFFSMDEEMENIPSRMSRPKLPEDTADEAVVTDEA